MFNKKSKRKIDFDVLSSAVSVYNNSWHHDNSGQLPSLSAYIKRFPNQQIIGEVLSDFFSCPGLTTEVFLQNNPNFDPGVDCNFYIACLEKWIKREGLQEHILLNIEPAPQIINEMNAMDSSLWEDKHTYRPTHHITIQNLIIMGGLGRNVFSTDTLHHQITSRKKPMCPRPFDQKGLHITFENNIFQSNEDSQDKGYLWFYLSNDCSLEFKKNDFYNLDLYIQTLGLNHQRYLSIENTIFNNIHVSINIGTGTGGAYRDASSRWYVSIEKQLIKERLEERINNGRTEGKIKINEDDMIPPPIESIVMIKNSKFNILNIGGNIRFFFKGNNTINTLRGIPEYIHFDSPQNIDPNGKAVFHHKELFSALAKRASKNKDFVQEYILKNQIRIFAYKQVKWQYRNYLKSITAIKWIASVLVVLASIFTLINALLNIWT